MSDLKPRGVKITLGGEEREFLFTLNAIEEIQAVSGKTVFEVLQELTTVETQPAAARLLTRVLYNDSVEMEKFRDPNSKSKTITDKEAGWLVTYENLGEVVRCILQAYGLSVPEEDDENTDPNSQSGQQDQDS